MMNKRIRSMIDEIFSEMKMTAENLALRDELMANAQARCEDSIAQGRSEEEAFCEVAASLGDVRALLGEMNGEPAPQAEAPQAEAPQAEAPQAEAPQAETPQAEPQPEAPQQEAQATTDLGDALGKAFSALGDLGQTLMPQTRKFVREVDDATGGVLSGIGKAVRKGMIDAQKAAGDAIDRMSGDKGELVFDFGPGRNADAPRTQKTPQALRDEAADIRAQAELKEAAGDQEGARELRAQAYALETQAETVEQAEAMEAARRAAEQQAEAPQAEADGAPKGAAEPLTGADGEIDEDAFARAVDEMAREAEAAAGAQTADYTVRDAKEPVSGRRTFSAAGLHGVDVKLDADDVEILPADGAEIETLWEAQNVDGEPVVAMEGHTLVIRRKHPDVFKTFFSVFTKEGGRITVRVPRGYAAGYTISTTSGDVHIGHIDADEVKVNTTSGNVRVETDAASRVGGISVTTVSGHATVSACAGDVSVTTVSGDQFISCDAGRVDVNVVSGKVHVEGACEQWEIDSVSGDVELLCTVAPTRKVDINTMSANVRLALPGEIRGFAAEISAALGGSIVNEFGPNRYGTCALPIHMDTMSGKLIIARLY